MNSVIHHIEDSESLYKAMWNVLPVGSLCRIVGRPADTILPLFQNALRTFAESCSDLTKEVIGLESAGFNVKVKIR